MPSPGKVKPVDNCPLCYLERGTYEPMQYQPGGKYGHTCAKGHEYSDSASLAQLIMDAFPKKTPTAVPPPPKSPPAVQPLNIPGPPKPADVPPDSVAGATPSVPPVSIEVEHPATIARIGIDDINFVRLTNILGHFTDASSMYGSVFSLQKELLDTKEQVERLQAAKTLADGPRPLGGDLTIHVIIPERHADAVKNVAESHNLDIARFMDSVIERGLDNNWFFTSLFSVLTGVVGYVLTHSAYLS